MIIKKEADRKFYNSQTKRYITLNDIFLIIKQNVKIKVIDHQDVDITKDVVKKAIMTHCKDSDEALEVMFDYFNKEPILVSDKFVVIERSEFESMDSINSMIRLFEKISKKEREKHITSKIIPDFYLKTGTEYTLEKLDQKYHRTWNLLKTENEKIYILMTGSLDLKTHTQDLISINETLPKSKKPTLVVVANEKIDNFDKEVLQKLLIDHLIVVLCKEWNYEVFMKELIEANREKINF